MDNAVKRPRLKEFKVCSGCKVKLPRAEFGQYAYTTNQGKASVRLESKCKSCRKKSREEYLAKPEAQAKRAKTKRKWDLENQEHVKAYRKEKQKCPIHKANKAKLQRIRNAALRASVEDKEAVNEIYRQAMLLQSKLRDCVDCDDPLELQIHVDHIIPVAMGGKTSPNNLQLLSGKENLEKGAQAYSVIGAPRFV